MPAYGRKKACNSAGLRPVIKLLIILQGCHARLPGKILPVLQSPGYRKTGFGIAGIGNTTQHDVSHAMLSSVKLL
jgi:hypothetical protein